MLSPRLSVVIPCRNGAATIGRLLDSLRRQTLPRRAYEILVVDDGSDDGTADLVSRLDDVILLRQPHRGPGAARNLGTAAATGACVLYLDADVEAHEELLATHLRRHEADNAVAATGGSVLPAGPLPLFSWRLVDHLSSWFNAHAAAIQRGQPEYLPSLNFCIKRERVFGQHGIRWIAGKEHTGEDVVFCHALRRAGLGLAFVPDAAVYHHDRATLVSHLAHMYRWGRHAPVVRGRFPDLRYSWLFPAHPAWLCLTTPMIVCGYTALVVEAWLRARPLHALASVPQIALGRAAYAAGVVAGTVSARARRDTGQAKGD